MGFTLVLTHLLYDSMVVGSQPLDAQGHEEDLAHKIPYWYAGANKGDAFNTTNLIGGGQWANVHRMPLLPTSQWYGDHEHPCFEQVATELLGILREGREDVAIPSCEIPLPFFGLLELLNALHRCWAQDGG